MKNGQGNKIVAVNTPAGYANNTSPTMATIDTAGFAAIAYRIHLGSTDIALTACKIRETDTIGASPTDITGATLDTATDIFGNTTSLPSATADGSVYEIIVNLKGRKRYQQPLVTVGSGTAGATLSVTAELMAGLPVRNVTESGAAAIVVV